MKNWRSVPAATLREAIARAGGHVYPYDWAGRIDPARRYAVEDRPIGAGVICVEVNGVSRDHECIFFIREQDWEGLGL